MTRKTRALYDLVFSKFEEILPRDMNISSVISDYETALVGCIGVMWPGAQQSGCWFHYSQAIYKRV